MKVHNPQMSLGEIEGRYYLTVTPEVGHDTDLALASFACVPLANVSLSVALQMGGAAEYFRRGDEFTVELQTYIDGLFNMVECPDCSAAVGYWCVHRGVDKSWTLVWAEPHDGRLEAWGKRMSEHVSLEVAIVGDGWRQVYWTDALKRWASETHRAIQKRKDELR